MTQKSGTRGSAALNKEMFHVKHHPGRPHSVPFQCAPESPAEASTTASVRQTLSAHVSTARRRPREVDFMFRLVVSESVQVRGDRPIYRLQDRASRRRLLFPQITPENPKQNSPRPQSFLIHNHSFPPPHSFNFQNPLDIPSLLCYTVPRTNAGVLIAETPSGDFPFPGANPLPDPGNAGVGSST